MLTQPQRLCAWIEMIGRCHMGSRLFICGNSALDIVRRLRAAHHVDLLAPSRIKSLVNCAHTAEEIRLILARLDPMVQDLLPAGFGTAENPIHIGVAQSGMRARAAGIVAHMRSEPFPAGTYCQISDDVYVLSPEACFAHAVLRTPLSRRLMLAMEMTGTYVFSPATQQYVFDAAKLTSLNHLANYCARLPHARGTELGRTLGMLYNAAEDSASPMETVVTLLVSLPYRYGGYAIETPVLNKRLDADGNEVPAWTRGSIKPDIAWLSPRRGPRLALEYNGVDYHCGLDDYERDSDRRDRLEKMGFRVIPISRHKLYDAQRFHEVACDAAWSTGKILRLPHDFAKKRDMLRSEILPMRRPGDRRRCGASENGASSASSIQTS